MSSLDLQPGLGAIHLSFSSDFRDRLWVELGYVIVMMLWMVARVLLCS